MLYLFMADQLVARGVEAEFIALGDAEATTYGFEAQWVARHYDGAVASFRDHLLRVYPHAAETQCEVDEQTLALAAGAGDIAQNAKIVGTLEEAVEDCTRRTRGLSVGSTSGSRRRP